jgi:microcystin-dependent protein
MAKDAAATVGLLNRVSAFTGLDYSVFGPRTDAPSFSRHISGGTHADGSTIAALPAVSLAPVDGEDLERAIARLFTIINTSDPAGIVKAWPLSTAPAGHLLCDGSAVSQSTYSRLFTAISTTFNNFRGASNPASDTFRVPDFRGYMLSMAGAPPSGHGSSLTLGGIGGYQTITLNTGQIPAHTHSVALSGNGAHTHTVDRPQSVGNGGGSNDGRNSANGQMNVGGDGGHSHTISEQSVGGGLSHDNMPPYAVVNFIIRY